MNFRPRRRDYPELNLIPMIDVLIVLLIFLVLTTTFSREAELQIQLPEATGQTASEEKSIDIVVDTEGRYFVNEHQVVNTQIETLKKAILEAAGERKDPLLVINADQRATHQSVITVLDAASQLGFTHVTFAAKSEAGETH
ncbi:ExbD/TolR family protein [Methylocaldum szegediense]|jgi:biopolymer transport protein ExbD|uniref:Biopolymer transport protein ExbD n=1 Tax=Methylocaldum szegediense TaxID=73780 RepID=A0ABM9HXS5_9GAMM|nr:biopolymer transporter ExbD [Methylocaldum szegediense]CAI8757297.1 biopolymer transport protein ExbD [Methylocaldum szegediense]